MRAPSHADAFEVLCLQAADNGRKDVLLGESVDRARTQGRPFMLGEEFPSVYLEMPLIGDPFLDVTILYAKIAPQTRVDSPAAGRHEAMFDWYAEVVTPAYEDVCCGFELDTSRASLPEAAVHFQPRIHTELVRPFCEAIGEPERADLYLDLVARMPAGWPLSFFGLFRGRPGTPMRVCGYLGDRARRSCANDPAHLAATFDQIGFTAYDDALLAQACELMASGLGSLDFQFDVYPDGHLSDVFALDLKFEIEKPEAVLRAFDDGPAGETMRLFERWGIADERWKLIPQAAFARSLPVETDDGGWYSYAFTLMPGWAKVRWSSGVLQPSKFYFLASAGPTNKD